MLSRVLHSHSPYVLYCAVAALGFLAGNRLEPILYASSRPLAAEARGIATPSAPRLTSAAPFNSGAVHKDAIDSGAVPAAPTIAEATPAETTAESEPKPSLVSGTDPDSNTDFVELKDLPVVQGQGGDSTPARDVDVIGDDGVPVPDKSDAGTTDKASN